MKRIVAVCVALACSTSVAHADLRYTTHVTVRTTPAASTSGPAVAAVAATLKTLMPVRSTRTFLTDGAARIEPADGAGPVTLVRDEGVFVLDAMTQTYWRLPSLEPLISSSRDATPPTFRRTGEHVTVAGLRAERVVFSGSVRLPVTPAAGFPTTLVVEGELWVTAAFGEYGTVANRAIAVSLPFLRTLPDGLVVRQILRHPALGYEVELAVSDVLETPLPREMFELPDGYREVRLP